jgi:cysteine sulfinate desulfinase/cysteine desulfurase-like protein
VLRVSFGRDSTEADVARFAEALRLALGQLGA